VLAFRYPLNTALTVAASLAQIGEFSFILAGLGSALGLLPPKGMSLVLAGALISIALNPLVFAAIEPYPALGARALDWPASWSSRDDPLCRAADEHRAQVPEAPGGAGGLRPGGRGAFAEALSAGQPFVVAEQNRELVERLRKQGIAAVFGNAADPAVLIQAHIAEAGCWWWPRPTPWVCARWSTPPAR
jgi:CPA2 family monovalent cation:H+ antiporter-2